MVEFIDQILHLGALRAFTRQGLFRPPLIGTEDLRKDSAEIGTIIQVHPLNAISPFHFMPTRHCVIGRLPWVTHGQCPLCEQCPLSPEESPTLEPYSTAPWSPQCCAFDAALLFAVREKERVAGRRPTAPIRPCQRNETPPPE